MGGSTMEIVAEFYHFARVDRRGTVFRFYLAFDKAAQALARIAGKVGLADFTVVDDVEPAGDLLFDDFGDRFAHALGERRFVDGLAGDLSVVHRFQVRRLRQRAGVGSQDSIGAI